MIASSARRPWVRPLSREASLPSGVLGPVLLRLLARLAASRAGLISRFGPGSASVLGSGMAAYLLVGVSLPTHRRALNASPGGPLMSHYRRRRRFRPVIS